MCITRLERSEVERANQLFGQDGTQQRGGIRAILKSAFEPAVVDVGHGRMLT